MPSPTRLNIYLDSPELRVRLKVAAARLGVSVSELCNRAIRECLEREERLLATQSKEERAAAAAAMDKFRGELGPVRISIRELIEEGRR